jgi:hypothetical protein
VNDKIELAKNPENAKLFAWLYLSKILIINGVDNPER